MKREKYDSIELEVIAFGAEDIVTQSPACPDEYEGENPGAGG